MTETETEAETVKLSGAEAKENAALRHLQGSLDAHPNDSSLHFDLGVLLWGKAGESKEKAAEHFLISAKLNPQNGAAFKFLGDYYRCFSPDTQRALKCYQRAVSLNPDDSDSGEALCCLLDRARKESLEVAVCLEASDKSPRAFWAFRRLGYLQVHQKKWSEAVLSLQHAIRGYPTCAHLWEALGLAYQRLGRFTAAIKAYGRAVELDQRLVFALVESGNIFLTLGSYRKGVEQFREALDISPHCVSASYGLASGLLGLANECTNLGAFEWGASLLEEASLAAIVSTCLVGNMSCIWKLHGDIQLGYAKCCPWVEKGQGLEFDKESYDASITAWKQTCCSAAISAKRSYQRALHLAPWQANIYTDIAICANFIISQDKNYRQALITWQLPEKMSLGALSLEGENYEFWVALGCLSDHNALKQHALIRGLQLDVSLANAWAYLGKLYRKEGEEKLARQAFDCARSIDPSLALPWAGMSSNIHARETAPNEAFENCLRAVQILPIPQFQLGLANLALLSGRLSSSQVFGAIQQAVQRAPHCPESHNLQGLVYEARNDYQCAATSYRLAQYAISANSDGGSKSQIREVSINLARSLARAGKAGDALRECETLKKEGTLDATGLQIYAFSLWQLGENDIARSVARILATSLSNMEQRSVETCVSFICRLLYHISGMDIAISSILKMPNELFQNSKVSFIISALHALDHLNRLEPIVSSSCSLLISHEEIIDMHLLMAFSKMMKNGSEDCLRFQSGVAHLRKALHMFPNCSSIRYLLGYLLVSSRKFYSCHLATRCYKLDAFGQPDQQVFRSATDIIGAGPLACYAIGNSSPRFSYPTCMNQCPSDSGAIQHLQMCLHQKPWDQNARYLLVLDCLQKAREERFPHHLCAVLERLISVSLSNELYATKDMSYQYQKFQLLLCASEVSIQCGNQTSCISYAKKASEIVLPATYLFFAHLFLFRVYAMKGDVSNLQKEYMLCLELKTDLHIGWISLKMVESLYKTQKNTNVLDMRFKECLKEEGDMLNRWMAVFDLVKGLICVSNRDFLLAEEFLSHACLLDSAESCFYLCHGAICMELARQYNGLDFVSMAVKSLTKAQENSVIPLPLVSMLLAQAEGSLGSREKWYKNLQLEWFAWPPEMRPAEIFFQMHLLSKWLEVESESLTSVESCQSPQKWVLRAIHTNPSIVRFWNILQKFMDESTHTA